MNIDSKSGLPVTLSEYVFQVCANCGVEFASPVIALRLKDGQNFYCPNGHSVFFPKARKEIEETERLERMLLVPEPIEMKRKDDKRKWFWVGIVVAAATAHAQVLTRSYTNDRAGAQTDEMILTRDAVVARGIVRLTTIPVYGDARGMESQPLIVPGVQSISSITGPDMSQGDIHPGTYAPVPAIAIIHHVIHDVLVLPSMANVVRGVDAATGATIWQTTLGRAVDSNGTIDFHQINQHWGCLSTGVVDPTTNRLYQVCQVSPDGTPANGRYFMHVLNVADGTRVVPPVPVQGSDTSMWKQRSALIYLPTKHAVCFAHGSVYETATGMTGGITCFDTQTNTVSAQLAIPEGIWMAGQGLVGDAQDNMYAITGNGAFDPSKGWYGESFIRVKYDLTTKVTVTQNLVNISTASLTISPSDVWSPYTDYQRTGKPLPAMKMAGESAPSEAVKPVGGNMSMSLKNATVAGSLNSQGQAVALVYPDPTGAWSDEDFGSAGPAYLSALRIFVAAGKDGIGYSIHQDNIGGTTAATVGSMANYAKLAAPCQWLTIDPGPVSCSPADARTLNFLPWGRTAHLHMTPVQFYDTNLKSWVIFVWGENERLHKWAVSATGLKYVAQGNEFASADSRNAPGGMPGAECSLSSNNGMQAVLWCSVPYGDANATITNGRFLAYDPLTLQVLWDSQRFGVTYVFNKFMTPTVWNGRVYLPNYSGGVDVYGLGAQ